MKTRHTIAAAIILAASLAADARTETTRFHSAFKEDFSSPSSEYFRYNYRPSGDDFRYCSGIQSLSEEGTDVMLYRIDPKDPAGAGRGPEIISEDYTFYGSYSARFKVPDIRKAQPDAGAVVGYFTYNVDRQFGQSEIDVEFLIADPRIIYIGTWTGKQGAHNRIGRIINIATGEILETIWRSEVRHPDGSVTRIPNTPFKGRSNKPEKIEPIEGFDASAQFHTYGWDWYPDRLVWWMIHPRTGKKVVLWDYKGTGDIFPDQPSKTGIPCLKSKYRLNFWHTDNWPVETNPNSVEAPKYPFELEIDWMSYKPFDKYAVPQPDEKSLEDGWKIQSCAATSLSGRELSLGENADLSGWHNAGVPSTVLGALTSEGMFSGALEGADYHTQIDRDLFKDGWWYVTSFDEAPVQPGQKVLLDFEGISYRAEVWLNGKRLASSDEMEGPFRQFCFDITDCVQETNRLAVKVLRAGPGEFNIGFVDWNPRAADESMGIFRPVKVRRCNRVSMSDVFVRSSFKGDDLGTAYLKVGATLQNRTRNRINGHLVLNLEGRKCRVPVNLAAGERKNVELGHREAPLLKVDNPRLWWCHNLGSPEMYHMDLYFETGGAAADARSVDFGIRKVDTYLTEEGHRGFILNGKKVLVKGAGWTDDIFLRNPDERNAVELDYVKAMNLNAVRFENFWGVSQDLYDQCDRKGLLALAGWSCFWEWMVYSGVPDDEYGCIRDEADMDLIAESLRDQIVWLRNHPSIIAWYTGSDKLPRPELEKRYLEIVPEIDDRPVIMSAKGLTSRLSGPTGMKMVGPYDYQGPEYWYNPKAPGGAFGFNTETGIGAQIPQIESLRRMIPQDRLWPVGPEYDFHCTTAGEAMHSLDVLKEALNRRYGKPGNLEDFVLKAHHLDYDGTRAMFEAFRVNVPRSTGVIQWMLNSAWPSLYWQLYDWYLVPSAGFWAVKKACAPRQLVYNYYDRGVYAVADENVDCTLTAKAEVYGMDGKLLHGFKKEVEMNGSGPCKVFDIPRADSLCFLFLSLEDPDGKEVSDNSYCLSAVDDVHDWGEYNWIRTPLSQHSDFTPLDRMEKAELDCKVKRAGRRIVLTVRNCSDKVAFFLNLALKDADGEIIVPVTWEDNNFSLKPGETRSISCRNPWGKTGCFVEISGWNVDHMRPGPSFDKE